jgi:HlyD family secretion protein
MKRKGTLITLIVIGVSFILGVRYIWLKDQQDPIIYQYEQAQMGSVVKKTVATGSIVPKEEVLIKPNISGIIDAIFVEAGAIVKTGDLIAQVRVVPNINALNSAQNGIKAAKTQLETARLALERQTSIYERQQRLYERGVISANEFDNARLSFDQATQRYNQEQVNLLAAEQTYDIVKTGSTKGLGAVANTEIRATVSGMILDVPVKVGNQVIEANNFNDGTTIAILADVNKMIFEGKVDESEVGKITENLALEITVGAIENKSFDAILDYIAPKGVEENGAVQFEIKGSLSKKDTTFIRAGLSANASIILARADSVLTIKESVVQYDRQTQQPFVEIETGNQEFERRDLVLGISEVISGVSLEDQIKVWNQLKQPQGRP